MKNKVAKTAPLDRIKPDNLISLFFSNSVYTLNEIKIPVPHAIRRMAANTVPTYFKDSISVKFQTIKLIILIRKTKRVPITTFRLLPLR